MKISRSEVKCPTCGHNPFLSNLAGEKWFCHICKDEFVVGKPSAPTLIQTTFDLDPYEPRLRQLESLVVRMAAIIANLTWGEADQHTAYQILMEAKEVTDRHS